MSAIKDSFSSKWGLIFAAAGSAIGLGNIWLFPYRVGELGGAAFIIPYITCLLVLGFIAVIGEVSIGRLTGSGPVGAFKKVLEIRGKNGKMGEIFGWICVLVSLIQAVGYTLVVSWVVRFLVGSATGSAFNATDSSQYFDFVNNSQPLLWIIITVLTAGIAIVKGIEKGIERCCKFMIPAVIILLLVLAIRVIFLPHALEGYKYLLTPRWEFLFDPRTWMLALGQVFYSLSIRGSTMVVYGSYSNKSDDIISSAKNIVVLDTMASIIAALLIIPAVFAFGKDIKAGPALMFITMPDIFKGIPLGQFFMFIFFIAVFSAAITSLIGMFEVVVEVMQNKLKISRLWAVAAVCVITAFMCNIFVVGNIRCVIDILEIHLIPFCALVSGIFFFWIVPKSMVFQEIQSGRSKPIGTWTIPIGRYVLCSIVIIVYILNILQVK
ncbi:sodium-dependent transporter [Endomicrobiia bacterium]|uniref:sodium-dependent transporter n=1 Tax=Endomicrobium trichonymphae TaxID=1408204 RepID=UPI00221D2FEA|nr:sodium-dependent transporter [Endomicrobiia bacterium]GMO51332.1 MAG: sodium-dependent transporter [Candidatus Endomicrobium trichonymphae]GHT12106.1 sodium-dependent transporter [Endomicrobiia bacterium]GHT15063.1 sodium-dependent transporter [Endomicrobiia bacterium]GHT21013.1 sodium-dependent transporter [Endomicrobiia bacterium]